jgi:hypothetical protein
MGKKKKDKEKKKLKKALLRELPPSGNVKSKCCKKFKKGESKRCKKCPCFDLMKKVA